MYMQNDTGRSIAAAIGDIEFDTSGLAKDETLQATNDALGAINTTLGGITTNDPPTDTTQQSIATAITALGSTLGSDKANIDGSNIANPSAFRSNIGLQIDTFSFSGSANSWYDIVTNCPLNGYVPLGFIGNSLTRSHWSYSFLYDGNTSSTYWSVRVTSPVTDPPTGTYTGRFIALKIN